MPLAIIEVRDDAGNVVWARTLDHDPGLTFVREAREALSVALGALDPVSFRRACGEDVCGPLMPVYHRHPTVDPWEYIRAHSL